MKTAKVIPILKKGDSEKYENYRPIPVLSCFSKILEKLMFNRILDFLNNCNILCNEQYGFRPEHSAELALVDAIDNLYFNLDNSKTCIGVFLDLSKAFDTINHTILINKLSVYGIRGTTLNWIEITFQIVTNLHRLIRGIPVQNEFSVASLKDRFWDLIYNNICHVVKTANNPVC